jgi:hypothetical protein
MNDTHLPHFDNITDHRKEQRSERRANVLNLVQIARVHAGRGDEPYSQSEADVIMLMMELLDRVAGE